MSEVNPENIAYLSVRLSTFTGKPQRYGTQLMKLEDGTYTYAETEDVEHLDERRRALGLLPIKEYVDRYNEDHKGV